MRTEIEADGAALAPRPPRSKSAVSPRGAAVLQNPFPGPQPYRAADRERFHGREDLSYRLTGSVLANRCVTVHGPSGAGKSSLLQASVIPELVHAQGLRVARVDGWPEDRDPTTWLADSLYPELALGERPPGVPAGEALLQAAQRAARKSPRLVLVYLDQIEQLLYPGRGTTEVEAFFAALAGLVDAPLRNLRVVLTLREDYLGRFRDRLREHRRLLSHGFRVGPLTVAELAEAVCKVAASGDPPQEWALDPMRALMLQVRVPGQAESDDAEAQAAYAQIVCRALFQQRAQASSDALSPGEEQAGSAKAVEAEPILRSYLETTLDELGDLGPAARRLLEDHLVTADGSRTLRTEKELLRLMPASELGPILKALEGAAILHAEEHQGSRYFEIGHDWLARRVFEARRDREQEEEQRRREEEQRRREEELAAERERERLEVEARLAKARSQRRFFAIVAVISLAVAAGAAVLGLYAREQQKVAVAEGIRARKAEEDAKDKAVLASDARLLAGFRELKNSGQIAWGVKLLPEVQRPASARGWTALASDALGSSALFVTLRGHDGPLRSVVWSRDGKSVLSASTDGTARLWSADGRGDAVVFKGHKGPLTAAAVSPDGGRILTASDDGTARLWQVSGGSPAALDAGAGKVISAAWSPDGARVVTASEDRVARVWSAGGADKIELRGHTEALTTAVFFPDGTRVLTASEDGTARVWPLGGAAPPVVLKGPKVAIAFAAPSPDGTRVLTGWSDGAVRLFDASGKGLPVVLEGHEGAVLSGAWSPDGQWVATASTDKTARVWSASGAGPNAVLTGHGLAVTFVAFRPDGRYIATASLDQTARLWPSEGGAPLVLTGHDGPVLSAAWSPDGGRVLTAAAEPSGSAPRDTTVRIWRPADLESLPRERREIYHSACIGSGAELVASAYDDKAVRVWRADGTHVRVALPRQGSWVAGATFDPARQRIAAACFDGAVRIVRADGQGEPKVIAGHTAAVRAAVFHPDGTQLVTVSDDRTARIVPADGRGDARVLSGHTDALTSAAWSPGGERVVTTSMDHTARVWLSSGKLERVLSGHGGGVWTVAVSPDGAWIATGSEDGTAQIWDLATGTPKISFDPGSPVLGVVFDERSERLAISSRKGGVLVARMDGKGEPVVLTPAAPVLAMAFTDGGKRLFTVTADNATRTFTLDEAALRDGLRSTNVDCLPFAFRVTYLGEAAREAGERYAACEREQGRAPFFGEGKAP